MLFAALIPTESTRETFMAMQNDLRQWGLQGSWTHPDDFHLTLCRCAHPTKSTTRMIHDLADVAQSVLAGSSTILGLGALARKQQVKALHAAVSDESGWLSDLHHDCCDAWGQHVDPHFKPHVNVFRPSDPEQLAAALSSLIAAKGHVEWDEFAVEKPGVCERLEGGERRRGVWSSIQSAISHH